MEVSSSTLPSSNACTFTDEHAVPAVLQHLTHLLAAPVPEVVAAALQAFQVLLRKTHHTSVRWTAPPGLSQRLLCLSKGWGGKEEVRTGGSRCWACRCRQVHVM
jgi:hypothetical protein